MRNLWNIISFLAVVHLLAIVLVIGWLWQSGRLNVERVSALKGVLSKTIEEEAKERKKAEADEAAMLDDQKRLAEQANPAIPSADQVAFISLIQQRETQAMRRLADEKRMLLSQLDSATTALDEQREELRGERTGWETAVRDEQVRRTDEQFRQAVKQYESLPPKQGKQMLLELVTSNQRPQAVAYLDAMSPRAVTKILKEFKSPEEIRLAMELLEELRTFGLAAEGTAEAADAKSTADAQPASVG